eukprot:4501049-Prymnesium_polylepis.1
MDQGEPQRCRRRAPHDRPAGPQRDAVQRLARTERRERENNCGVLICAVRACPDETVVKPAQKRR